RLAHELEKGDHVLIVRDDAVELLEEVENNVGFPAGDRAAQISEGVEHPDTTHVVTTLAQSRHDVVFGAPLLDFLFGVTFQTFRGDQARMYNDKRAQFFHSASLGVSPWEYKLVTRSNI